MSVLQGGIVAEMKAFSANFKCMTNQTHCSWWLSQIMFIND